LNIARAQPLGIGLWNFESVYDAYDTLDGEYGRGRAVHNSFLQALTETGWFGGTLFLVLCLGAFGVALRVRARSRSPGLAAADQWFLLSMSNALLASMAGFMVGGFFLSMAYNDLTWLTFATLAALDRVSAAMCRDVSPKPAR
jgi:O-antigen ligase